jgi:hypothetical protein
MTTCQQRQLFWGPKGGRCTQVWLYIITIKAAFLSGQEELTGAKDEEVILSARTNAKPTL